MCSHCRTSGLRSGSRGLGHQVATDALTEMDKAMSRDGIKASRIGERESLSLSLPPSLAPSLPPSLTHSLSPSLPHVLSLSHTHTL